MNWLILTQLKHSIIPEPAWLNERGTDQTTCTKEGELTEHVSRIPYQVHSSHFLCHERASPEEDEGHRLHKIMEFSDLET